MAKKLPPDVLEYFRQQGKKGGSTSGKNMTAAARLERARKAGEASGVARKKKAKAKKSA
jgi:hypothetical protein